MSLPPDSMLNISNDQTSGLLGEHDPKTTACQNHTSTLNLWIRYQRQIERRHMIWAPFITCDCIGQVGQTRTDGRAVC